ncbi:MAG: sigma-54-dependent Fis family transcriptional regulator [Planctomycetes bacterium]|nr:sigma-54-dependent Fis family transcriptional regulator [Planctomycetota bacterium]
MTDKILVVDDDQGIQFFLGEALSKKGYQVDSAASAEDAMSKAEQTPFMLVLLDVKLPGMSGIDAIKKLHQISPLSPIIIMTAFGNRDLAIRATQEGAYDFLTKPIKLDELFIILKRALEKRRLKLEISHLEKSIRKKYEFENIIGSSGSMQEVFEMVQKVAGTDSSVIIYGESGTGKELIAHAIHANSGRREKSFVKLNCVAIPEGLLESELFGHEKGSFTGAVSQKIGKFELANEGTIFLDEIGDMTITTQAKILRVLQEREFERVGGTRTVQVNVRIIAATNKDLQKAVEEKQFREDLYFRLNVVPIYLPPLRERKEDIPPLVEHFLKEVSQRVKKQINGVSTDVMDALMEYPWPGNVRELENCIERACVVANEELITRDCLPLYMSVAGETHEPIAKGSIDEVLAATEKKLILDALKQSGGVQAKASRLLSITERSLWHRIKKYNLKIPGHDK